MFHDPFVYIIHKLFTVLLQTLQLEWTNHCACFNTYSKSTQDELKNEFKNQITSPVTEGDPSN